MVPAAMADAPGSSPEWWRGASIYQIYPRSFQDTNGDGVGDLPGITAHLPYVADLGVDAIWVSPFFTSPMKDFGYDVSNYRDVDPTFGSLADFDRLVAEAHRLGAREINVTKGPAFGGPAWTAQATHQVQFASSVMLRGGWVDRSNAAIDSSSVG